MIRRVRLLWVPVLAALLLAPVGRPRPLGTRGPALAAADALPAVGLVRQLARIEAVSRAITPAHRHDGSPWAGVPAAAAAASSPLARSSSTPAVAGLPAETARHFPLFPTGPPLLT
jgi:hypothetical protein